MRAATTLGRNSLPRAGGSSVGQPGSSDIADGADSETLAYAAWQMQKSHEQQHQPDSRIAEDKQTSLKSTPSNPENPLKNSGPDARAYAHDDAEASDVWTAATEKAISKQRTAKDRKAHMPRLRFRLRQYEKYPRLDVSTTGAVTNFMGLSLQATNPANFMWDTIYKRSERQITCTEENAMDLLRLYDSLVSLKERHHVQSGGRTPGPLAAILENVQFTDRMDTFKDNVAENEWAWVGAAASGSAAVRTPPSNASSRESVASRGPGGPAERNGSMGTGTRGLAHAPRGHGLSPPLSPVRKQQSSDEIPAQHINPLARAAVPRHQIRPQTIRAGALLPPAGGSGDPTHVFEPAVVPSGNGAVNDIGLTVLENPLSAPAAGAGPFDTATQQMHIPPLFNSTSFIIGGDGDGTQGYGVTDRRHEALGADRGSSAAITGGRGAGPSCNENETHQGSPRPVPLFMAAVVDDRCNDLGSDDHSARAEFSAPGGGGDSSFPRARVDASSEAVFEQEVQLPLRSQAARPAVSALQLAQPKSHLRRSTSSQDSEIESEVV